MNPRALIVIPLACASVLAVVLAIRHGGLKRWFHAALIVLLTVVGAHLLAHDGRPGCRGVVIVDADEPSPGTIEQVRAALRRFARDGLGGYQVIRVAPGLAEPSDPSTAWRMGLDWSPGSNDGRVGSPGAAIAMAAQALGHPGRLAAVDDLVRGRVHRVLIVASAPEAWRREPLDVLKAASALIEVEATADLLVRPDGDPSAHLEVLFSHPTVAPNAPMDSARIRLRMTAPIALPGCAGEVVNARVEATIDDDPANPNQLRAEKELSARVDAFGAWESSLALADFKTAAGAPAALDQGTHRIRACVRLELGARPLDATATAWWSAQSREAVFVAGAANRLLREPAGAGDLADSWGRLARWGLDRWPADVGFSQWWDEARLRSEPENAAPYLLVLHDLTDATLDAVGPKLERWVRAGTHLVVCGLPRETPARTAALPFLPAWADAPADLAAPSWIVDRRPLVTFVADLSRLGRLPLAPATAPGLEAPDAADRRAFEPPGLALQRELIRQSVQASGGGDPLGPGGELGFPAPSSGFPREGLLRVTGLNPAANPAFDLIQPSSWPDRLASLVDDLPAPARRWDDSYRSDADGPTPRRPAHELGPADLVVMFTFDGVRQPGDYPGVLARLLARGARVLDVRIGSPFLDGANRQAPASYDPLDDHLALELDRIDSAPHPDSWLPGPLARQRYQRLDVLRMGTAEAPADPSDLTAIASRIAEAILARTPREAIAAAGRFDRALDERMRPLADPLGEVPAAQGAAAPAAPLRFQLLRARPGALVDGWVNWPRREPGRLRPVALAVARRHGRGEVLALGYSIFEGATTPARPRPFGIEFDGYGAWPVSDRVFPPAYTSAADAWGPQRVLELAAHTSALETLPPIPPALDLRRVRPCDDGGMVLTLATRIVGTTATALPGLTIAVESPRPGPAAPSLELRPSDLRVGRGEVDYRVSPASLRTLLGQPGQTTPAGGWLRLANQRVFAVAEPERAPGDQVGQAALDAVVRYSGGGRVDDAESLPPGSSRGRLPSALGLTFVGLILWSWRVLLRHLGDRAARAQAVEESARLGAEEPAGLNAQVGEALGVPVAGLPAGTYADRRPLEAGDPTRSVLVEDVVLAASGTLLVPRTVRRFDDRASKVTVLIDVGSAMRCPSAGAALIPPKVAAAATLAELIAQIGWSRRAEVAIRLAGIADPPRFEPTMSDPGEDAVRRFVTDGLRLTPASRRPWPWPAEAPDEAVVVISDFLGDGASWRAIAASADRVEQDGGRCGAVCVHSPAEFQLLGLRLAGGAATDRLGYEPADLEAAQTRLIEDLEALWGGTRGGLSVVSSALGAGQMLEALRAGRLLEILV